MAPEAVDRRLVVAISSRTLFDLDDSHAVFERAGVAAYADYQVARENQPLPPGVAFPLVRKLLGLNQRAGKPLVEVILLSRNSSDTGLRVFNSIQHYGLDIVRAAFTGGAPPYTYIAPFEADLFLSANGDDVRRARFIHDFAGCGRDDGVLPATVDDRAQRRSGDGHRQPFRLCIRCRNSG